MKLNGKKIGQELTKIVKTLNKKEVKYLVTGGVAAILYAKEVEEVYSPLLTKINPDIDLILKITEENLTRFQRVLLELHYIATQPINLMDMVEKEKRQRWVIEKGANGLIFSAEGGYPNIDVKIIEPEDYARMLSIPEKHIASFDELYCRREEKKLEEGNRVESEIKIDLVGLDDLLRIVQAESEKGLNNGERDIYEFYYEVLKRVLRERRVSAEV